MPSDTILNSTLNNNLDDSLVIIHVTGLRQHKHLRHSFDILKVPRASMSATIKRINRMGGKIIDVKVSAQYELEADFISPEIAIDNDSNLEVKVIEDNNSLDIEDNLDTKVKDNSDNQEIVKDDHSSDIEDNLETQVKSTKKPESLIINNPISTNLTSQSFIKPIPIESSQKSSKTDKSKSKKSYRYKSKKSSWKSKRK